MMSQKTVDISVTLFLGLNSPLTTHRLDWSLLSNVSTLTQQRQKSCRFRENSSKSSLERVIRSRLPLTSSNRGSDLENTVSTLKYWCRYFEPVHSPPIIRSKLELLICGTVAPKQSLQDVHMETRFVFHEAIFYKRTRLSFMHYFEFRSTY